jgi:hypothetical protein
MKSRRDSPAVFQGHYDGCQLLRPLIRCGAPYLDTGFHALPAHPVGQVLGAPEANAPAMVAEVPAGEGMTELDREIANAEAGEFTFHEDVNKLIDLARSTGSLAVQARLRETEAAWEAHKAHLQSLYARREAAAGPLLRRKLDDLREAVEAEEFDRVRVNTILRQAFRAIIVDRPNGVLRFQWAHGGEHVMTFGWPEESETAPGRA